MSNDILRQKLNAYGRAREPILFIIDFEMQNFELHPLSALPDTIRFSIEQKAPKPVCTPKPYRHTSVDFATYRRAFDAVIDEIRAGNSYLLNLTFPSKLSTEMSLEEIYEATDARFKLLFKDRFVSFSPERFVNIVDNRIYTYPMKGTIDATRPDAAKTILDNPKEMAEHVMVVDLLRNDLSRVASHVRVDRFRYIDTIKAGERELLQVSSKISGDLPHNWQENLGDILLSLLPAGSITGAPKKRTTEIIRRIEEYERGYFTGIFGIFDGEALDSAVMIRFIEQTPHGLLYKSGGGITIDSDAQSEYNEMQEKIYVPFF